MTADVVGDELQIDVENGMFELLLSEAAVDKLADILEAGKKEFRRLDEEASASTNAEPACPAVVA